MSLHHLDRYPTCDWCNFTDRGVIESRIGQADLHEACVEGYCREQYPEDYDEEPADMTGVKP
jgi:hypothetical protein